MTPIEARASFAVYPFVDGSRRILGSNYGFADPAVDFPRYAGWHLDGRLPVERLIDRRIGLDDLEAAFDRLRAGESAPGHRLRLRACGSVSRVVREPQRVHHVTPLWSHGDDGDGGAHGEHPVQRCIARRSGRSRIRCRCHRMPVELAHVIQARLRLNRSRSQVVWRREAAAVRSARYGPALASRPGTAQPPGLLADAAGAGAPQPSVGEVRLEPLEDLVRPRLLDRARRDGRIEVRLDRGDDRRCDRRVRHVPGPRRCP